MSLLRQIDFNPANMSAFGVLETAERTPVLQGDYAYGLNTQIFTQSYVFTITDATTDPVAGDTYSNNNSWFTVVYNLTTVLICYGTGAPAASGTLTRVTGSGDASITYSAVSTITGVYTGSGALVDTNAERLRVQSGTGNANFAWASTRRFIKYRAGQGTVVLLTPIFPTGGKANSIQLQGVGNISGTDPYDGYFWGYNGTSFGIAHYVRGTPTWYAQTVDWNGDKVDGSAGTSFTLNKALGTPMKIKYPYLGYGDIFFEVQNPSTGAWVLVHTIRYANTVATTQLSNPTMQLLHYVKNSGNTDNITLYNGSYGAFISGVRSFTGNPKGTRPHSKSSITTETNIISLKNAVSYNAVANRALIRLGSITWGSSAASGTAILRLYIGATLGGTPSFAASNGTTSNNGQTITAGNSVASYDTAGTTVTGGTLLRSYSVDNPNTQFIDLSEDDVFIAPGEVLTISAESSATSTIAVSVNWSEDI